MTPATFESDRRDENLVAALGPACNRVKKISDKLGPLNSSANVESQDTKETNIESQGLISDENDCLSIIQSWMGQSTSTNNTSVIKYADVDRNLGLEHGSAKKYIEQAVKEWRYVVSRKGETTILFKEPSTSFD